jgi:hypothetical protein
VNVLLFEFTWGLIHLGGKFADKIPNPSDAVGPGSTALTVTPVPALLSANPREIANCAVFVHP